jgi:hypothetical protein
VTMTRPILWMLYFITFWSTSRASFSTDAREMRE